MRGLWQENILLDFELNVVYAECKNSLTKKQKMEMEDGDKSNESHPKAEWF